MHHQSIRRREFRDTKADGKAKPLAHVYVCAQLRFPDSCIHTHTYIHMHIYIYIYMRTYVCMFVYTYLHI